jgi:hypothetical protein
MKSIHHVFSILILVALVSAGCGKELEQRVKALEQEKAALQADSTEKAKALEDIISSMSEIQTSINSISDKQNNVRMEKNDVEQKGGASAKEMKTTILSNLGEIDKTLAENKQKIAALNQKVKSYKGKIAGLEKMVANLNETVANKEREVVTLKQEVARLNIEVVNLTTSNQEKDTKLRTAYYLIGTDDDLDKKGVYKNKGGMLGIGRTAVLSDNLDLSLFTKVDVASTAEISIPKNRSGVKVLSNHPSSSYELESVGDKNTKLKIKDADAFWQKSKALVVMLD